MSGRLKAPVLKTYLRAYRRATLLKARADADKALAKLDSFDPKIGYRPNLETYDGLAIAWAVAEALHDRNRARTLFATHYHELAGLETRLAGMTWATGEAFTLADCAAAPALFYADWVRPIGDSRPRLAAYRRRLLAHPAVSRAVEEARQTFEPQHTNHTLSTLICAHN